MFAGTRQGKEQKASLSVRLPVR
ncbi:unnamed protein product [Ectocarpus sp. CCAP 1310/34]|nr:unnamed protein product [Ectocarpus sp. CCAP 1310/34]